MTAQIPDSIIFEGRSGEVLCELEYLPENTLQHLKVLDIKTSELAGVLHTTACWRCHIYCWEVNQGDLYLTGGIGGLFALDEETSCRMVSIEPIKANWVNRNIRLGFGVIKKYEHKGYLSNRTEEIIICVEDGHVINTHPA